MCVSVYVWVGRVSSWLENDDTIHLETTSTYLPPGEWCLNFPNFPKVTNPNPKRNMWNVSNCVQLTMCVCHQLTDRKKNPTSTSSIDTELATYNFIPLSHISTWSLSSSFRHKFYSHVTKFPFSATINFPSPANLPYDMNTSFLDQDQFKWQQHNKKKSVWLL